MNFEKMTQREQVLIMIVVAILVGGAFALLRYVPQTKALNQLSATLEINKQEVKNPKFPEEPEEDVEDLKDKDEGLKDQLDSLRITMETEEKKLASANDNQDMLLRISEAARAAGVKVIESIPYLVQRIDAEATDAKTKKVEKKSKSRRRNKALAKMGRSTKPNTGMTGPGAQGAIPREGELIYHLVNDFDNARPLQKLSVEGNYRDLQTFMLAISNLQYQVTIVKLDIDVKIQTPAQGVPQPLMAKLIIAM
jgi:Tfp pilus assembly protein PilO